MKSNIAEQVYRSTPANSCFLNKIKSTEGIKENIEPAQFENYC